MHNKIQIRYMRQLMFYHLIMYLEANDIKIEDVMIELEKEKND